VATVADRAAEALAMKNLGVVTRHHAKWLKLTERQIDHRLKVGTWVKLFPRVYVLSGAPRTWRQRLVAAGKWARHGYAFSHRCAAALWGFERFPDEVVEITITRRAELPPPEIIHRVERLRTPDLGEVDGLKVTSVTRTLLELAATCHWANVEASVNQALRSKRTSLDRLERALEANRAPLEQLRALITRYCGGEAVPESVLAERVLAVFEAGGLPRPLKQKPVFIRGRLRRLDFIVPGTSLVVEADGYATHALGDPFEDDRTRDNELGAEGVFVQRWTWRAIHEWPEVLIENARRIIARSRKEEPASAAP
jgi:hypothetical protein